MDDSQLLKGILEGCVLSIIARGETYGYQILADLEECGFDSLLEGTLYPVLGRLEKRGYLSCRKGKSPYGPVRKYYSISMEGRRYLDEFRIRFGQVTAAAASALSVASTPSMKNGKADFPAGGSEPGSGVVSGEAVLQRDGRKEGRHHAG